jgi:hypothetical protein
MLPSMASFTPLRYPMPCPITQPATVHPPMESQVRPLGRVHVQCIAARLATSPIRNAVAPMPIARFRGVAGRGRKKLIDTSGHGSIGSRCPGTRREQGLH